MSFHRQLPKVPCGLHSVVQYAHYLKVLTDLLVEDNVRPVLVTAQSCSKVFSATSESRIVCELIETRAKFIAIPPRLFNTVALDGVLGDRLEVHCRAA